MNYTIIKLNYEFYYTTSHISVAVFNIKFTRRANVTLQYYKSLNARQGGNEFKDGQIRVKSQLRANGMNRNQLSLLQLTLNLWFE